MKAKGGATAMNQGPLLRVKFGNLIQSVNGGGLRGWVNGFTFDPALEFGMFHKKPTFASPSADIMPPNTGIEYYPKTFRVNCELNVLHEHALGFSENSKPPGKTKGSSPKSSAKYSLRSDALDKSKFPYDIGNPPPSQGNLVGKWNSENDFRDVTTKAIRSANPAASNSRIAEAANKSVLLGSDIPYKGDQGK